MVRGLVLCALLSASIGATPIYKIVKEDGTVVFTDRAVAGAQPVSVSTVNVADPLAAAKPQPSASQKQSPATPSYQVSIRQPANEENVRDNAGNLTVTGAVSPPPSQGQYRLMMDGEAVETANAPQFSLTNVDRGAHQLQLQLLDSSGKILASSPTSVFYLHRHSVLHPSNAQN